MSVALHGSHLDTYNAIFRHPAAHNLGWRDVHAMLAVLADVSEESNGSFKVTRNGHTMSLHPHRHKDVTEMSDLMQLRHFLKDSEAKASPTPAEGHHFLVVIDHREARVFKTELHGTLPHRIQPLDPDGFGRHLHYVQDDSNGQRKPESGRYYDAVIKSLQGAEKILVFGAGTGASSAMTQLVAELNTHHKPLAARVIDAVVVDETHMSDDQLLAKARAIYEKASPFVVA